MKSILLFLLLSTIKCSAQSGEIGPLPIAPPTYDTIPCHLLYRTKAGQVGIVKGWEVVKNVEHKQNYRFINGYRVWDEIHVCYLLSNRRRFPKGTEVWKLDQPIKQ